MTENNIRSMRVRAGLSQEDVASSLPEGTNRVMVSFMEAGRTLPTVDGMKALCDLFICSPSDLYLLDDLDLSLSEQFPTKCSTSTKTSGGGRGHGHEGMWRLHGGASCRTLSGRWLYLGDQSLLHGRNKKRLHDAVWRSLPGR